MKYSEVVRLSNPQKYILWHQSMLLENVGILINLEQGLPNMWVRSQEKNNCIYDSPKLSWKYLLTWPAFRNFRASKAEDM